MPYAILYGVTEGNRIDGKELFKQVYFEHWKEHIDNMLRIEPNAPHIEYRMGTSEQTIINRLMKLGNCKIEWQEVDCEGLKYRAWVKVV